MRAVVMKKQRTPLEIVDLDTPKPVRHQVLIEVGACAVCRTDLHVLDGELPSSKTPLVLGHEIVGRVVGRGEEATRFEIGARVGVPWLGGTCGTCSFCARGRENLCDHAHFTGYTIDGGYAEFAVADERFCFAIPERYTDVAAAPLLCAGLIGYRSLRMTQDAQRLGIYGFGAAGHIVAQVARHQGKRVFAFTRRGDETAQALANSVGVEWVGASDEPPPEKLDAAILYAPDGALVPRALRAVDKGGRVVCAGIHSSDIPSFPYAILWGERSITSVANLTRADGEEFLRIAGEVPLEIAVQPFRLESAPEALASLRAGTLSGVAVLDLGRYSG